MGVWIEIRSTPSNFFRVSVTPCVGVWIEIEDTRKSAAATKSLPAWECGLKLNYAEVLLQAISVTPCVGVWIEIQNPQ